MDASKGAGAEREPRPVASVDTAVADPSSPPLSPTRPSAGAGSTWVRSVWTRIRLHVPGLARHALLLAAFVGVAVMSRGALIGSPAVLNPDEAELFAQARGALRNPVPYTTWNTSTTGPMCVLIVALIGALGFPLTIPFAHLLSSVLFGVLGYFGYVLAARTSMGRVAALLATAFWWLPMVFAIHGSVDFGALQNEMIPITLVVSLMLFRPDLLARRPWLYSVMGLLGALAIGSKYQMAPLVAVVLVVQLVLAGDLRWRTLVINAARFAAGALAPALVLVGAMLISPNVDVSALRQTAAFLDYYGSRVPLGDRLHNTASVMSRTNVALLLVAVAWLAVLSTRRVAALRLALVGTGAVAVFLGGMGFGHYLIVFYLSVAMAFGLPLRPGARVVPFVRGTASSAAILVVLFVGGWLASFGPSVGLAERTKVSDLYRALTSDATGLYPAIAPDCPAGSRVFVWGWASELYVFHDWENAFLFVQTQQQIEVAPNREPGLAMVREVIDDDATDCVIDAVGSPFFAYGAEFSLTTYYPEVAPLLAAEYRRVEPGTPCEACAVYVRR